MLRAIDHVAIAVKELDQAIGLFEAVFGVKVMEREFISSYGVEIATIEIGGTSIELIEGKSEDSKTRKYVEKHGPGIHHIAFSVEDIEEALAILRAKSVKLIDEKPRRGRRGSLVAFLDPDSTGKILYELVQLKNPPKK